MAISITKVEIKRKCMVTSTDTTYDTSIDALIAEMQPGIEYSIDDTFINDTDNTNLQATLKLGMMEIISGEFLQQLLRETGASETVSISGISIGAGAQHGVELIKQGNDRLKPFLKLPPAATDTSQIASTASDSSRVFNGDSMKGW